MIALVLLLWAAPVFPAQPLTPSEIQEFHDYRRPRWIRGLAETFIEGAFLFWMTRTKRLHKLLRDRPDGLLAKIWRGADWPSALALACAFALLWSLLKLPFGLIFDWYLDRLSDQSLWRYLSLALFDAVEQAAGMAALAFGVWGILRRLKRPALALGIPAGILVALAGSLDPYALQMRNSLTRLAPGPARDAIESLLRATRIEAQEIDVIDAARDTRALDAFVTGQGPTRRIVLFDTLVAELPPREIAVVVAHELGHIGEQRWRRAILAGAAIPFLLALIFFVLRRSQYGLQDVRSLPLAIFVGWLVLTIATPFANAWERHLELRADEFALNATNDPEAFRSAMFRIARSNKLDPIPPRAVVLLLDDHPPLSERIALSQLTK